MESTFCTYPAFVSRLDHWRGARWIQERILGALLSSYYKRYLSRAHSYPTGDCSRYMKSMNCAHRERQRQAKSLRTNLSLNRTRYGRPAWLDRRCAAHRLRSGEAVSSLAPICSTTRASHLGSVFRRFALRCHLGRGRPFHSIGRTNLIAHFTGKIRDAWENTNIRYVGTDYGSCALVNW